MKLGSSVNSQLLQSCKLYQELLINHFDFLYVDSGFLPEPERWERAKLVSEFATGNGKQLRGNHLIDSVNTSLQINYITKIIKKFPEIKYWDCVLEAIADKGNFRMKLSQSLIDRAYVEAKSANPENLLFYCDYYRDERKWKATYKMLESMKSREIPIDGLAVQLHSNLRPPLLNQCLTLDLETCALWMNRIKADFNIIIHAPEIVVWQPAPLLTFPEVKELNKKSNIQKELLRNGAGFFLNKLWDVNLLQKEAYSQIVSICKNTCEMIGFWSAFDRHPWNWIGNRAKPGLWDNNFVAKAALDVLSTLER